MKVFVIALGLSAAVSLSFLPGHVRAQDDEERPAGLRAGKQTAPASSTTKSTSRVERGSPPIELATDPPTT